MKHYLILFFITTIIATKVCGQALTWDPFVMSTLVVNHTDQQAKLKDIKNRESSILAAQVYISDKMEKIRVIKEKMHKSLRTVSSVITDTKEILYAREVANDIGKYQNQMIDYARDNPKLLLVAYKTEKALVDRTADLFTYIYTNALVGGDLNLLDNRQRGEIIDHVVQELRIMRGLAYGVSRKMRMAKRTGVLKALNPFGLSYPNQDAAIV